MFQARVSFFISLYLVSLLVLPSVRCSSVGTPRWCKRSSETPVILYPTAIYQTVESYYFCGCSNDGQEVAVPSEDEYFSLKQEQSINNLPPKLKTKAAIIRQTLSRGDRNA